MSAFALIGMTMLALFFGAMIRGDSRSPGH
jgi:hypothetical protein